MKLSHELDTIDIGLVFSNPFWSFPVKVINSSIFKLSALSLAVGLALVACGGSDDPVAATDADPVVKSLSLSAVAAPITDAEKRLVVASSKLNLNGTDYDVGFNTLMRSGDVIGTGTWGQLYDVAGGVIKNTDGSPFISNAVDHNYFINAYGKLFVLAQFEDTIGVNYITELKQDTTTGLLTAVSTKPIDASKIGGTWTHCAGSNTPWNTALGSEEYETNAANVSTDKYFLELKDYFKVGSVDELLAVTTPYNYGFITEMSVTGADLGVDTFASNVDIVKHYSMGRLAFELGYVMPNQKTVYMSDDGSYVGFFRYEAVKAGDLTSGTLYAAKLTQKSEADGGSFDLSWIDLGSATDSDIKDMIDEKPAFTDIFEVGDKAACSSDFKLITTTAGTECLKVKTGKEKMASRLETRRYAAMLGATTELNKEEGITYDPVSKRLFVAMSFVEKGMDKAVAPFAGVANHIQIPKNACGTVYALDLDDNYVAKNMYGLISGTPTTYDAGSVYAGNTCDIDGIANVDNVTFFPGYDTLVIGEDTGSGHQNDAIWSYNLITKKLTRIFTTPYGAETTSPYVYPNLNGFGYMTAAVQHPYGESDGDEVSEDNIDARRAYAGYIGPFPKLD